MSKDTIKVNMNVYDIPIVVEQLKKLEQENKQLKEENKYIEQWWKETNVIIRNEKSLAVNDNAMEYILNIERKLDKTNEILNKCCFEYDNCPDSVINEIIELKEILGDKE